MLTLADLGVLRERRREDGRHGRRDDHPDLLRLPGDGDDARRPGARGCSDAGFRRRRDAHRAATRPWTTDWITAAGRRKLAEAGIAPPGPAPRPAAGPVPLTLRPAAPAGALPALRLARDTELMSRFGATACKALLPLPRLPGAVRARQGDLSVTPTATARDRAAGCGAQFHTLTVADVEPLCDDAVAITFDVPDELADEFAFRAGQSLTLRRVIDGRERAPLVLDLRAGGRARRASACARSRTGCSPAGWSGRSGRATRSRCRRRPAASRPDPATGGPPRADRGRLRDHAGAVDRGHRAA